MTDRHPAIVHFSEIEDKEPWVYPGHDEPMSRGANYRKHFGFTRIGIHYERLSPGRRTSFPHAESAEEEFVFVVAGTPDVWLDGYLHRLGPGDAVGFPAGTGVCHTFINNTNDEVNLLVVGEASKPENRYIYPIDEHRKEHTGEQWWDDAPVGQLGPHDGLPDRVREARKAGRKPE